jgi:hypothetical protein
MSDRSSRSYGAAEIAALATAGILGFIVFHRLSSYGDDFTAFSRVVWSNGFVAISDAYVHLNGRLGDHFTIGMLRLLLDPWRFGPESFPWWALFAASYYFLTSAALRFAVVFARSSVDQRGRVVFVAALTALLIIPTVSVLDTATYAVCITYTVALWLMGLSLASLSMAGELRLRTLGFQALIFMLVSLSSEQMLVATPVLFAGLTAVRWLRRSIPSSSAAREISTWFACSTVSALVYFLSPGQRLRNPQLGVHNDGVMAIVRHLPDWYGQAVNAAYEVLFGRRSWFVPFHTILLAVLLLMIIRLEAVRRRTPADDDGPIGASFVALLFLAASTMSLAHLLVSPHFPEGRARFFPAFLLATGLASTVVAVVDWFRASSTIQTTGWLRPGAALTLLAVAVVLAVPHMKEVVDYYRRLVWLDRMRTDVRHRILRLNAASGATRFRLSGCIMDLDAAWGFDAYFAWIGKRFTVVPIGLQHLYPAIDRSWTAVGCDVLPLITREIERSGHSSKQPVRVIHYGGPGATQFASWDSDFWVAPQTDVISLVGDFNPNSQGGPPYRDTLMYRVVFGTRWDSIRHEPYVVMEPQLTAGLTSPHVTSSINYVYGGELTRSVPLSAFAKDWPDRPFVRLGIRNAVVASPGWTSNFLLREE